MTTDFTPKLCRTWVGVGTAAVSITAGVISNAKAKKEAKKLQENRPVFEASPYLDNQINLAESELANGMSARSEQIYGQQADRAISSSLNSILQGGGSVNNVADLFDASDQGRQRFAMMNDNLRLQQINNLVRAQGGAETQRQQQFQFNEYAPWTDASQANALARQGAQRQINNGINTAGSALMGYANQQGWGSGNNNRGGLNNISGSAPQQTYSPPPMAQNPYNGSVANQYQQISTVAPNMPINYNNMNFPPYANVSSPNQPITPW